MTLLTFRKYQPFLATCIAHSPNPCKTSRYNHHFQRLADDIISALKCASIILIEPGVEWFHDTVSLPESYLWNTLQERIIPTRIDVLTWTHIGYGFGDSSRYRAGMAEPISDKAVPEN